jgi:hypothetical protein
MVGFAKAILIAILAAVATVIFTNMVFFFPWYLEIVETTFVVSQIVTTDNYLAYDEYQTALDTLKEKPIFKDRESLVSIEARHESGRDAIERVGPYDTDEHYYNLDEDLKPYEQMGNLVTITIRAAYPFRMHLFGTTINLPDIPVSYVMSTTTSHHYKDLPYDYGVNRVNVDGSDYDY